MNKTKSATHKSATHKSATHKSLLRDVHTWKVCYTETQTKKRKSFTCTEKMKKAHEMNLNNNPFVMDVMMVRAGRRD